MLQALNVVVPISNRATIEPLQGTAAPETTFSPLLLPWIDIRLDRIGQDGRNRDSLSVVVALLWLICNRALGLLKKIDWRW
jgi:hypothetical protein